MAQRKKYTPEQIVSLLWQVEVAVASGKTTAQASKAAGTEEMRVSVQHPYVSVSTLRVNCVNASLKMLYRFTPCRNQQLSV
jgi:hypothetical protein